MEHQDPRHKNEDPSWNAPKPERQQPKHPLDNPKNPWDPKNSPFLNNNNFKNPWDPANGPFLNNTPQKVSGSTFGPAKPLPIPLASAPKEPTATPLKDSQPSPTANTKTQLYSERAFVAPQRNTPPGSVANPQPQTDSQPKNQFGGVIAPPNATNTRLMPPGSGLLSPEQRNDFLARQGLAPQPSPQATDLGGMCLAPGASVATFGRGNAPLKVKDRLSRSFDSVDAATAYARGLGKPATVVNEGNGHIAIYTIDPKSFERSYSGLSLAVGIGLSPAAGLGLALTGTQTPFTGSTVLPEKGSDQTNVQSTNGAVQTIITQDGFQLTPGESGMHLADFAQSKDQQSLALSLQKRYAGHRKAFGDGLQDIKDKDQFLKQYDLGLRDTAFHLLRASELEAQAKQKSFENGLPATEAPKIHSVSQRLESLDQQLEKAKWDRTATDIAAGQSNEGLAMASLFSDTGKKAFEDQLNAQQAAHDRVQQLEQQRKAVLAQYPLLERVNPADFNKLSDAEQAKVLQNACGDVLKDIATTRQNIVKGKINLMQLAPLVGATNEGLGIQPEQAEWIAQKASSDKKWDTAGKIGLGALSVGLGIAATFATGGLALALGIGAVGVGLTDAALTTDEYLTNQAATNTSIDPNQSLMPQDMKGHWGWVVASWVGAGLDIGAAVKAARLLKTGMTVEEVIKTTSKAHNIPEEVLQGAYAASGKGTSDPVMLKKMLTSALPKEVAEQAGKNVDVTVLSAEEFAKQTGSKTGNAVTKLVKGEDGVLRAQVIVREGADPNVLLEEAAHVAQLSDPKLMPKLAKLSEENLANWPKMTTQQKLDVYKAKIELEIDAQRQLLQQAAESNPGHIKDVQHNLDNLQSRLAEVDLGVKNPKSVESEKWLHADEKPRLFNKNANFDLDNAESLRKDQIAHSGWYGRKKMRQIIHDAEYSSHGGKHIRAKTIEEARQMSFKTAQYLPGADNAVLEKIALQQGTLVPRPNGAFWKIHRFDKPVGFDGGVETHWIRAEYSSGTYHGHPMSIDRVRKYIKDAEN